MFYFREYHQQHPDKILSGLAPLLLLRCTDLLESSYVGMLWPESCGTSETRFRKVVLHPHEDDSKASNRETTLEYDKTIKQLLEMFPKGLKYHDKELDQKFALKVDTPLHELVAKEGLVHLWLAPAEGTPAMAWHNPLELQNQPAHWMDLQHAVICCCASYEPDPPGYLKDKEWFHQLTSISLPSKPECDGIPTPVFLWGAQATTDEKRVVILAFRGTSNLKDVLIDADITGYNYFRGKLHKGFFSFSNKVPLCYAQQVLRCPKTRLLVTGHSLGGSLATIYTLRLFEHLGENAKRKVKCITFGHALVGNEQLVNYVKQHNYTDCFHHVVHPRDPTPACLHVSESVRDALKGMPRDDTAAFLEDALGEAEKALA
eukprot:g25664.t1